MSTYVAPQGTAQPERRRHPHLRAIFDGARLRIAHLYDADVQRESPPRAYLAQRLLHESYPQLSSHDLSVLVNAIERRYTVH